MKGFVRGFQRDNETGLMIPDTYFEGKNTIQNGLRIHLAYNLASNQDKALNSLFTTGRAPDPQTYPTGDIEGDGIAHYSASAVFNYVLDTDLNAGGTGAESYFEYLGTIAGPVELDKDLVLGHNLSAGYVDFTTRFSTYSISESVSSGRTFYFYWRITLS